MPVYSIILPVYNVEKYLSECLDSILAQDSPSEYEVILVDDGSSDNSGAICDTYAAQHENFHVTHIPNGGVSNARNIGVAAAKGEYVLFCDPDDLYAPGLFTTLTPLLEAQPDIVSFCGQFFAGQERGDIFCPSIIPQKEPGVGFVTRCFHVGCYPPVSSCLYLFRRQFLTGHGFQFQTNLIAAEDMNFVMECLTAAAAITGTEQILYLYRIHTTSSSMNPSVIKQRDKLVVHAKWAHRFPCSTTANTYCRVLFSISDLGTRCETEPLAEQYRQNRDILQLVSERRTKFARMLFRILGIYNGSAVVMALIRLRHRILGIR